MAGRNSQWKGRGNKAMGSAPIANRAQKGQPKDKFIKRYEQRVLAWQNPESKRFRDQVDAGGAKKPGSLHYYN